MNRRDFLKSVLTVSAIAAIPSAVMADAVWGHRDTIDVGMFKVDFAKEIVSINQDCKISELLEFADSNLVDMISRHGDTVYIDGALHLNAVLTMDM